MANQERIKQLKQFCKQWEDSLNGAEKRRDELIAHQKSGLKIFEGSSGQDLLPTLILEEDKAVQIYKNCLVRLQSVLGRAEAGEDV